ncbi:hypothetical protein Acr_00g0066200 [Actinidia rufa]|uniref:HIT domain-containing protein n=1 Tax=Actinidia rufa TaxID=165716 RepID=A0A7J0DQ16_9ERIC|nr:hypothetical protein Acr_00g0066200 [Actinidia rufa]
MNNNSQLFMHLHSHLIPRPSASSPMDNRAHMMAGNNQAPDLEGLHLLADQAIVSLKVAKIQVGRSQPEISDVDHQVCAPDEKEVQSYLSLGLLVELTIRKARRLGEKDGHVAGMTGRQGKNASHLFTVHQKDGESLKDYVKLFNQAVLEIKDASDNVVVMAMMEGLRPSPLFDSISKNVPKTQLALQSKADKYIAVEELAEAKHRKRGRDDNKRKAPDSKQAEYRDKALIEIKHEEFIKWPEKIKTDPHKRNKNKYCEFYRYYGYNTEDCFQLKEQIFDLIKRGHIKKYVVDRPHPNSPKRRYGDNRPTTGDIQVIHGGFRSRGCSSSS